MRVDGWTRRARIGPPLSSHGGARVDEVIGSSEHRGLLDPDHPLSRAFRRYGLGQWATQAHSR